MVKSHTLQVLPSPPSHNHRSSHYHCWPGQYAALWKPLIKSVEWIAASEREKEGWTYAKVFNWSEKYVDRRKAARERPHALLQQKREGKFKMVRGEGVERGRTSILVWQPAVVGDHYSAKVGRIGGRIVEIWAPQSVMKRERKSILVGIWFYLFQANQGWIQHSKAFLF